MNRIAAETAVSASSPSGFPRDGKPEVALVGRSNVGKSSLINTLTGIKTLAKISSVPGKTQRINFYLTELGFYLVDLPGYGYARVPDALKLHWSQLIEKYLLERETLVGVIQITDFRHPPANTDREMAEMLRYRQIPFLVVATKVDKVPRGRWRGGLAQSRMALNLPGDPILFSAQTGLGKEELLRAIIDMVDKGS